MKDLKEIILNILVVLAGIYAIYIVYMALTKWGNL
jgi:hypothetical protein